MSPKVNPPVPHQPACGPVSDWVSSATARRDFRVKGCELMHLREAGTVRFSKAGRGYFYSREDLVAHLSLRRQSTPGSVDLNIQKG